VAGGVGTNLLQAGDHEPVARAIEGLEEPTHPLAQAFARFAQTPGNDAKALAAVMRRPEAPLTAEQLGRVTCPVLVVIGDKDFAGPAEPLVELLPDAKLTVLRGVDHLGTPGDFGFIDAALGFIDAVPA
jgi:pimeloyl-ACP methyl ester carboxylesterase